MKKLSVLAAVLIAASLSHASELWWTVGDNSAPEGWKSAQLWANTTGYNYGGDKVGGTFSYDIISELGGVATDITGYNSSAYSFYIELYNSSGDSLGRSYINLDAPQQGAIAYTTLDGAGAIFNGNVLNPNNASAYSFDNFTTTNVIPEPTSGLLVLLGMMALGLKRKRV